jgi:hypothetical protein
MDMKIMATRKMRKKCDMFPEEKKNYLGNFPQTPRGGG